MKKRFIRIFSSILILTALLGLFSGCRRDAAPSAENTVTFTDALHRTVTVRKNPERVAALLGSFADVWMLSGGRLCAAAEDAWEDFGLELPGAVNIGGAHSPNPELLLASDPEFVIASASTAADVEMQELLEASGIVVAYFDVGNFSDYLAMLDICTDITGQKDLFEKNGLAVQAQIEKLKAAFASENLPEEQRRILLLRAHSGSVKAKGSEGTVLGEMLSDLGCVNIADSDTSLLESLSLESILRQSPYRVFVVTMGNDTENTLARLRQMIREDPAWGSLEAISQNRLHVMDRRQFNIKPNEKWAEAYETLLNILLDKQ